MANPNSHPRVSILMPFLNAEATLGAALRSLLVQTWTDWELLLCDDGSSDSGLAVARALADPRIRVWSDGRRKGLAGRLNECIDRAEGHYFARFDSDDINYPERLVKQVEYLDRHSEIDLVGCQMLVFGEDGEALGKRALPCDHEGITATPQLSFGMGHPTWMGRSEWFRRWRYRDQALRYEDVELLYRSYPHSRFANLPELLYGYREMRGGFQKRLKTRLGRVQFLRTSAQHQLSTGAVCQAVITESIKSVSDAVLAGTGLRYTMLRLREQALSAADRQEWQELYRAMTRQEQAA